ncbi:MAG: hypothetical protein IK078_12690 [Lachnospiraceae bacterium]|nr:hypothetical protein [Lachnospiraceae bacterium]
MLTNEMKDRLRRAGEYQKKAIMELLPEGAEKHIDVIAGELKEMFNEATVFVAKECCKGFAASGSGNAGFGNAGSSNAAGSSADSGSSEINQKGKKSDGVRKVTIE